MVNVKPVKLGNRERMSFGKINEVIDMPNLIDVQKQSYQWFLDEGLKEVFKDVSGITDYQNNLVLDFIDYSIDVDHPNYSIVECKSREFSDFFRILLTFLYFYRFYFPKRIIFLFGLFFTSQCDTRHGVWFYK